MKSKEYIDCDVIQDLLPSYTDKISSDTTNRLVENHLKTCNKCFNALKQMNKEIDNNIVENQDELINYLKKYNKKNKIKTIMFITTLIIAIIFGIYILLYYLQPHLWNKKYYINVDDVNVEYMHKYGKEEYLGLYLNSEKYTEIRVEQIRVFEEIYIVVYAVNVIDFSPLFNRQRAIFNGVGTSVILDDSVEKIYLQDRKGNTKEIWNKDMEVMSEEEFKQWYNESYVPEEIKELYNYDMNHPFITDPGAWKNLSIQRIKKNRLLSGI